ncbi:MAG TPA: NAD-dependent epimerase/dehydratase family protein, partial [Rhodanobacteraceae bacterium]|nr:NAD-dependent epimerase/dehydratase family protein [Rhodanobacteraceae bacterium]
MTTSLVFGASGAIGRFLVPRLLAAGHAVIAVSRISRTSAARNLQWIVGDLPDRVPALPRFDVIFSLGPLDAFARWFADSSEIRARVIAIGSLSAQTKEYSADPHERDLAARLVAAEAILAAATEHRACAVTTLRASLIYGAGLDLSLTPFVNFARRWRVFPRLMGAHGLRQPVHADDLADACIAAATAPAL